MLFEAKIAKQKLSCFEHVMTAETDQWKKEGAALVSTACIL